MPTVTTTVTSACASGATTTVTTTEATPEPPAPAPASGGGASDSDPLILKDGFPVNESSFPKVGVPSGPEGITAEWFTSVFHARGIIGNNVSVTSIESKQIGEGRGYANYTFLVKLNFSRAVHADVPKAVAVKIANATFQNSVLSGKSEDMWQFFNDFYVCEATFYSDYRPSLTCAQPAFYWSEIEYPADPRTTFGHYGIMIEYLGDDLKMFTIEGGIPKKEMREALKAFAGIHAGSWNDDYCLPVAEGGANHYILNGGKMPMLWQEFGGPGWSKYMAILEEENGAECPNMVSDLTYAFENMHNWWGASKAPNKALSSMDLRSENVLWRKTADDFECVPIDHQAWWYGAPMRDIAMLLMTSSERDAIKPDLVDNIKYYHQELIAAGVDAEKFSWEQCLEDFAVSAHVALIFGGAMIEIIDNLKETVAAMDGTEDAYQETKNMTENFDALATTIRTKAAIGYKAIQKECEAAGQYIRGLPHVPH